MNSFTKRLIGVGLACVGFASVAFALSQSVGYKPWGVPESRRDEYDQRVEELKQDAALRDEYAAKPKPSAKITRTTHDFGLAHSGESFQHAFQIENDGNLELTLKVRDTSPGETSATIEKDLLSPGESTHCVVSVKAAGESLDDVDSQRVTIITNDPFRQTLVLSTTYTLRKEIVAPAKVDFGSHDFGELATADFVVYSQSGSDLEITDVTSDGFQTEWVAVKEDTDTGELFQQSATSGQRITIQGFPKDYGRYTGQLDIALNIDGAEKHATLDFSGAVRPPIGFYGPNVDRRLGVNFGTVENDKQHDQFVVVRSRADVSRKIEVLGVSPKELETELTPLEKEGTYRLRISIPKGCTYQRFNLSQHHGYVHVGDPDSKSYASSLPVYGVVGNFQSE